MKDFQLKIIPYEKEERISLKSIINDNIIDITSNNINKISVIIGPEGGFTEEEIDAATANGVFRVTLGPRILRTETAGINVLSILMYELGAQKMKKTSVVVIDDASFMRSMIKRIVSQNDEFEVVGEGEDGFEAIVLAKNLKPDIMTLDVTMPNMDGIDAIKPILKASPDTKILMVSAMGQQSMMIEAIKLGAKDLWQTV